MIPDIPSVITFELLKYQQKPLGYVLEQVPHVTREALLRKIFTKGLVAMITEVMAEEEDDRRRELARTDTELPLATKGRP